MAEKLRKDARLGGKMQWYRKQCGLSQESAAAKLQVMGLSVSREMLSQMELGRYSVPVDVLLALAEVYGIQPEAFLQGLTFCPKQE